MIDVPQTPRQFRAAAGHPRHLQHPGGVLGFTNLVLTHREGNIEWDWHVSGQCLLTLAEDEAIALREVLTEWPGVMAPHRRHRVAADCGVAECRAGAR